MIQKRRKSSPVSLISPSRDEHDEHMWYLFFQSFSPLDLLKYTPEASLIDLHLMDVLD